MEQSPSWEANRFSTSEEIPCTLWKPKVHSRIHNSPPPVPIQSSINPFYVPSYSLRIHFNIIFPSTPGSSRWCLSLGFFPPKLFMHILLFLMRATCPSNLILLDLFTWTVLGEKYRSLSSSLYSFLHSPVTASLLGPNILLSTLFPNTLSLRSYLKVSGQVPHPQKQRAKL